MQLHYSMTSSGSCLRLDSLVLIYTIRIICNLFAVSTRMVVPISRDDTYGQPTHTNVRTMLETSNKVPRMTSSQRSQE
jgi:hypothetical protein